jgi:F0F1-type ATP synthase membrane subunit b/b'
MDMVIGILKQLGADQTIVHQFIIVILMYTIAKFTFLDHLLKVITNREEKTVKLEGNVDKQFNTINEMANEYKSKLSHANKSSREKIEENKKEITKNFENKFRSEEKLISEFVDNTRSELEKELVVKKDVLLNEAEQLSNDLVQKIVKGN